MEKGNKLFHKLDRWVGIPLVMLLGAFKSQKKIQPLAPNARLAILNLGSIGDNVLMSAIIADLRSQYPAISITAFTGNTNYQIVKLIPGVDETIKLSITNVSKSYKLIKSSGNFSLVIDFGPWPRLNSIFAAFFNADQKIGFNSKSQFRHYVYDIPVKHSSSLHEIDNFRNLISPLYHGKPHEPILSIIPTDNSTQLINQLGKYCIIHPWPGGYKSYMKEWPLNYWVELINKINTEFDCIVITGAPSDSEKSAELFSFAKKKHEVSLVNLSGKLNLQELVHFISASHLTISVNTGVAHIAAAVNKKQVCLHGPTNVLRWRPYNKNTISIVPAKGHFGYLNYGYEYNSTQENCMENITVDMVYDAVKSVSILPVY
jgi:ADP-heptose:LPS heptosyltransferase